MRTILHVYSTFKVGGPQVRFARIAGHFGRRWRHLLVAMDGNTECMARLDPGLDLRVLQPPIRRGATMTNILPLRRMLWRLRPDLLVTSNWGSIDCALANLGGMVPHLHLEDGFNPDEAGGQLARRIWIRRLALRRSTVVLPSATLAAIARDVWRLPPKRLLHIPNGIDCARFATGGDPALAAALGLGEGPPVIGTVAALRPEKNLTRLLDAFALVAAQRPARLAIVGDGSERPNLAAHAARLGLGERVVFTGACPQPERLLSSFALFALSSDTEQMPLSVLEAMAAGLPVVATAVGDVARMVAEENAPHVVARDPRRLAGAMLNLLADPAQAAAIGQANAARAQATYDEAGMFAAYAALFG